METIPRCKLESETFFILSSPLPEIGEGALLLGMIAAGNATVLSVIQNGFAPVVAIPMTGDGDKPCDRGFKGENLGSHF